MTPVDNACNDCRKMAKEYHAAEISVHDGDRSLHSKEIPTGGSGVGGRWLIIPSQNSRFIDVKFTLETNTVGPTKVVIISHTDAEGLP